jgi:hypothetical protein
MLGPSRPFPTTVAIAAGSHSSGDEGPYSEGFAAGAAAAATHAIARSASRLDTRRIAHVYRRTVASPLEPDPGYPVLEDDAKMWIALLGTILVLLALGGWAVDAIRWPFAGARLQWRLALSTR